MFTPGAGDVGMDDVCSFESADPEVIAVRAGSGRVSLGSGMLLPAIVPLSSSTMFSSTISRSQPVVPDS